MKFGVKRLIAINSGKFQLAEFDLGHSIHLSAPNNRGKSTLVNALQFLYVDNIDRMHFGKRTPEDTRNHYFGRDPSYLVFECATPSGLQTLLVCGRGALQAGKFDRFVYTGGYDGNDYIGAGGVIRTFEELRTRLADRDLAEVRSGQLWEVLSGQFAAKGRVLPALRILAVRNHEEYRSFREVFVALLKLKNADARMLRRLIIACHAHDIGERRIDVAALYRDMFERATRSEEELRLLRAIAAQVDAGTALRAEIQELSKVLGGQAPAIWSQAGRCSEGLTQRLAAIAQGEAESEKTKSVKDQQRTEAQRDKWGAEQGLKQVEEQKRQLDEAHRRWGECSAAMIQSMRDEAAELAREVARREENIRQAGVFDRNAMEREVAVLAKQIESNRRLADDFDRTALAYLLQSGMTPKEIEKAFHLLHPDTLKLIVGEHVHVQTSDVLIARLKDIASRVREGVYRDDAVQIRLAALGGPNLQVMRRREDVAAQLKLDEQRLGDSRERLRVAEGLEIAKQELQEKSQDLARRKAALDDYDRYARDWAARTQLDAQLTAARARAALASGKVATLEAEIRQLEQRLREWRQENAELKPCYHGLQRQLSEYRNAVERLGLSLEGIAEPAALETLALPAVVQNLGEQIEQWLERAKAMEKQRAELKRIESRIVDESAHSKAQRIYFDDPDLVWGELAEKREALGELETSMRKQWDDLFTLLTANFEQIILGLKNVEAAVRALNRNIKSYQVSNLMAVDLGVEKVRTTYNAIETLANKGKIFEDTDNIELAKQSLRGMIEAQQVIELENLFEIQIRVQENDGRWIDAKSLDDIGSTGTGITAKAMIFIQLVRAIIGDQNVGLHFYLDETGQLDDDNLKATTAMAVSRGMVPITAQPGVRMESLAHPEVTVYTLGTTAQGQFRIDHYQTYHARRAGVAVEKTAHEENRTEVLEESA